MLIGGCFCGKKAVDAGESLYNNIIEYSCMFDSASSSYLSYDNSGSDPGHSDEVVISVWVKRSKLGTDQCIFSGVDAAGTSHAALYFDTDNLIHILNRDGGTVEGNAYTISVFRDCSSWYHIFLHLDNTAASQSLRWRLWVNGVQQTLTFQDNPPSNGDLNFFRDDIAIGREEDDNDMYFDGYMADFYAWHNPATVPAYTDLGELSSGVWIPKDYTTFGSNSEDIKLDFNDSSNLGDDISGNGNDYTANNMGTDHQVLDRPEDNYCTIDFNNLRSNIASLSEGGLSPRDTGAAWHTGAGTFLLESGKWYWEVGIGSDTDDVEAGIIAGDHHSDDFITADSQPGTLSLGYVLQASGSLSAYRAGNNNSYTADDNLDAPASGDVMTFAYDADTGKLWMGMWNAGSGHVWGDFGATGVGDPASGTNPTFTISDPEIYAFIPVIAVAAHETSICNFGQRGFSGTKPSGFNKVSSSNLTEPAVIDSAAEANNIVLWSGNDSNPRSITGVGFQPDIVWLKARDGTTSHQLYDSDRGAENAVYPDLNSMQVSQPGSGYLSAFGADGFTVTNGATNDNAVNDSAYDYVAWCLKKSATYGVDVIEYQGTGTAHAENHGLGKKPKMIIVKKLNGDTREFVIYHFAALTKTDPETDYGTWNGTDPWSDLNTMWNDTPPTSTQFTVGTHVAVNESGQDYVAYLFTDIEGLTKVFYYEGNASVTGPYLNLGFRPRLMIVRNQGSVNNYLIDTERNPYNIATGALLLTVDNVNVEFAAASPVDMFANGYKPRVSGNGLNDNFNPLIGVAFAEQPFKYANAR